MANSWFRLYHEFAVDPKVQMLSEKDQRRYIMLLCLRCCNGEETLHDDEVSFQLRISNEEWNETKAVLMSKNLINDESKPTAWDKRQFVSDSSSARVAKHRASKKRVCNVTVTQPDTDTDSDSDSDSEEELPKGNLSTEQPVDDSRPETCPHKKIIDLYNQTLGKTLPQCRVTNKTVEGNLRARWREDKTRQTLEWWKSFFDDISKSDFLMGRINSERPFQASFDWIIKPINMTKVLNGNYKNKTNSNKPSYAMDTSGAEAWLRSKGEIE